MRIRVFAFLLLVFSALFHVNNVDAQSIAFTSIRDGNYEIYVMDADGSNQTRLTNNSAEDSDPTA